MQRNYNHSIVLGRLREFDWEWARYASNWILNSRKCEFDWRILASYSLCFLFLGFNKKIICNSVTVIYNQNSDFDNFINSFISLCWKFNWDWKYFKQNPVILKFSKIAKLQNAMSHYCVLRCFIEKYFRVNIS